VLEEVGKTFPVGGLIDTPDVVPDLDRDDRTMMIFEDQKAQAIGESGFLDWKKACGYG
jgi:hypothetical protein